MLKEMDKYQLSCKLNELLDERHEIMEELDYSVAGEEYDAKLNAKVSTLTNQIDKVRKVMEAK